MTTNQRLKIPEIILLGIIFVGLILVAIPVAIGFITHDDMHMQSGPGNESHDPYVIAQRQIDNANINDALATYTKIIKKDLSGAEETAWYEKGKLLIKLGYCNEAMNHYSNYAYRFTDSVRAEEGFDMAKQC